jgi:hypothetical protein
LLGPPDNTFEPPKGDTSQRQVTTDKILEVDEFVDAEMEVVPETPTNEN